MEDLIDKNEITDAKTIAAFEKPANICRDYKEGST